MDARKDALGSGPAPTTRGSGGRSGEVQRRLAVLTAHSRSSPQAGRSALWTLSPTSAWRTPSSSCQGVARGGGGGAGSVPRAYLARGLVGRQTLPSVSLSPPTPSRNNQKLESATGACSPVGSRASRTLSRSCARRLVCASWECPWHRDSHPRAYSPFPRNGVLLCRG